MYLQPVGVPESKVLFVRIVTWTVRWKHSISYDGTFHFVFVQVLVSTWLPCELWFFVFGFMPFVEYASLCIDENGVSREMYPLIRDSLSELRLKRPLAPFRGGLWIQGRARAHQQLKIRQLACEFLYFRFFISLAWFSASARTFCVHCTVVTLFLS